MKPLPRSVLVALLLTFCALCAWQWHREAALRGIVSAQVAELTTLTADAAETAGRVMAANAEILRLTGTLAELRANSLPASEQQEIQQSHDRLREGYEQQTGVLNAQNGALTKANDAMQQANATIQKLTGEREALTKRLNETVAKYNKLAKP